MDPPGEILIAFYNKTLLISTNALFTNNAMDDDTFVVILTILTLDITISAKLSVYIPFKKIIFHYKYVMKIKKKTKKSLRCGQIVKFYI